MPESGLPIRVYKEHDMWHVDYGEGETEDHTSARVVATPVAVAPWRKCDAPPWLAGPFLR
jgi:hypothetical protein